MLIDTNVWSELLRIRPEPRVVSFLAENRDRLVLSAIVAGEMEFGIAKETDPSRRKQYELFLEDVRTLSEDRLLKPDLESARVWGIVKARLKKAGKPIADIDLLIAAQAIAADMPLVTRNISDMARTGATIINPWQA